MAVWVGPREATAAVHGAAALVGREGDGGGAGRRRAETPRGREEDWGVAGRRRLLRREGGRRGRGCNTLDVCTVIKKVSAQ